MLATLALIVSPSLAESLLFGSQASVEDLVHQWLHWAGNFNDTPAAPHPRAHPPSTVFGDGTKPTIPSYVLGALSLSSDTTSSLGNNGTVQSNLTAPYHAIDYSLQMMHRPEVDLLSSYLKPSDVYLEFGVGGSTVNFPPLVARAYAVEHDCAWAKSVAARLQTRSNASAYRRLRIKCVEIARGFRQWGTLSTYEHANYEQFREYVDVVDALREPRFDHVFIDGRARLACALKILPFLSNDSLVFIHDFYVRTAQYSPVLAYYTEVARVLATRNQDAALGPIDQPQGLLVLRKKPEINFSLSPDDIDSIYEHIPWRGDFGPPLTSFNAYLRYLVSFGNLSKWKRARSPAKLVSLVRSDLRRIVCLYLVLMFIFSLLRRSKSPALSTRSTFSTPSSGPASSSGTSFVAPVTDSRPRRQPRYVETDAMRAASARRNRNSLGSSSQLSI